MTIGPFLWMNANVPYSRREGERERERERKKEMSLLYSSAFVTLDRRYQNHYSGARGGHKLRRSTEAPPEFRLYGGCLVDDGGAAGGGIKD